MEKRSDYQLEKMRWRAGTREAIIKFRRQSNKYIDENEAR